MLRYFFGVKIIKNQNGGKGKKKKTTDIQKEITNLKSEVETINRDISDYHSLNKKYETVSKEVQNQEGELADYNLASDKLRSNMRPEDIEAVFNHIKVIKLLFNQL